MKRLDAALVEWGIAPSRNKAQALITSGEIEVHLNGDWKRIRDNSFNASTLTWEQVRIVPAAQTLKYVSRGGLKIEAACKRLNLVPKGWRCVDIGISTGGFTDFLLQSGASSVLGVDVGHGQLHDKLKIDPRLTSLEGLHVKDMAANETVRAWVAQGVDFCVIDVSFISLIQVLPMVAEFVPGGCSVLALVKPQFEGGPHKVTPELFDDVQSRVLHAADKCGFSSVEYFSSAVKGQDGNQEFFLLCRRR